MSNQALAERPTTDLRIMIQSDKIREQLAMALPHYYTPDQFTVIVRTAINKNPKLAECDPGSFMTAMITAAQMGLAPDGRNGHLIPRYNGKTQRMECQFQADYKGLVNLVRKNENVADIYAEPVHEADEFKITKGLHRDLIHGVDVRKPRGAFIGVYSVIAYKDGTNSFEFMSKEEVDAIKARSQSPNAGPWATDYSEMAKKTVIKRLLKLADLSQETVERINIDNTLEPISTVPEIKSAKIPERPALPENSGPIEDPTPEPEQQTEPEAGPTPEPTQAPKVEKSPEKSKPSKKLAAAPESTPEPGNPNGEEEPAENPLAKECEEKLKAAGFTPADLIRCAQANEWLPKSLDPEKTNLSVLTDDDLKNFIDPENWTTVLTEIKRINKK
jgi:recombination protein RecT